MLYTGQTHIPSIVILIKQDEESTEYAYCCRQDVGPSFGWYDLYLLGKNCCDHSKGTTNFENKLVGNALCGGDTFHAEDGNYKYDVVNMTTFQIDIT